MFSVDAGVCVQKLYVSLSALHGASESSQMTSPTVPCMSEHDEKGRSFCARLRMRGLFCSIGSFWTAGQVHVKRVAGEFVTSQRLS